MRLAFSSSSAISDSARLSAALRILLSPLDFASTDAWRAAVCEELCQLIGADSASFLLSGAGDHPWLAVHMEPAALEAYTSHYAAHDAATQRMTARRLPVAHQWMLWEQDEIRRSETYNDWFVGNRLHDAVGFRVETSPGVMAGVCLHHEAPRVAGERDLDGGVGVLRVLLPAFAAGVAACDRLARTRDTFTSTLDTLPCAMLVCDDGGTPVHTNVALARLLTDEPEQAVVRREIQALAYRVGSLLRRGVAADAASALAASRMVRTGSGSYALRATLAGRDLLGPRPGILVIVEPQREAQPLSDQALHQRFGLTAREVDVARLLARGLSNREVADQLAIRPYTARNHVERVLQKLAVPNRARVAALLLAPAPGPSPAADARFGRDAARAPAPRSAPRSARGGPPPNNEATPHAPTRRTTATPTPSFSRTTPTPGSTAVRYHPVARS
jgi:DNA-binding CsgD family transcriptional regulator